MKGIQRGISLLEILLVLAIIAIIVTMSVRYFTVSSRSLDVAHAITQIKKLTQTSYEWLAAQKQADFSGTPGGKPISNTALISAGLVCGDTTNASSCNDLIDPWGGPISVSFDSQYPTLVKIELQKLPQKACENLSQRLVNVTKVQAASCNAGNSNTYVGYF